jgi:hypothetical protein
MKNKWIETEVERQRDKEPEEKIMSGWETQRNRKYAEREIENKPRSRKRDTSTDRDRQRQTNI